MKRIFFLICIFIFSIVSCGINLLADNANDNGNPSEIILERIGIFDTNEKTFIDIIAPAESTQLDALKEIARLFNEKYFHMTATINTIKKLDYGSALKIKLIVEGYEPDLFISPPNDSYMGDAEMDKLMADIYNLMYGDALFDSEKYFMGAIYAFKKNGLLHEFPLAFKPFFL